MVLWEWGRLRKMNVCGERRVLTAAEIFAQTYLGSRSSSAFVNVCTPDPNCHILFPAKHLAAAQDNWLVSAEVIMVFNSSQQELTPKALYPALVYFHSKSPCEISLTTANTNIVFSVGERERPYLPLNNNNSLLKSNLPCKVPDWIPLLRDVTQ